MITAICQECEKQFDYDLKPGYPRKYCNTCKEIKKQEYADRQPIPVEKPGVVGTQEDKKVLVPKNAYPKDPVGLAVELRCAYISKGVLMPMEEIIIEVKQAQEAFS